MSITLDIPPEIERQLREEWNGELTRKILEAVAAEGYRRGTLSRGQVSELLSLSFQETELFLYEREACPPCTTEHLDQGRVALESRLRR